MQITNFDRTNLKQLRKDMDAAIAAVAKQHGIDMQIGTIRFSGDKATMKIEANTVVTTASVSTGEVVTRMERVAADFGIRSVTNAKGDKLIDYKASRPKYPFVYESAGGVRWKATVEQAIARFGRA